MSSNAALDDWIAAEAISFSLDWPESLIAAVDRPTCIGSVKNHSCFPLTPQCFAEFDWLAVVNSTTYARGGPELPK